MIYEENITATTSYISFRAYCNLMKALGLEDGHNHCVRPDLVLQIFYGIPMYFLYYRIDLNLQFAF